MKVKVDIFPHPTLVKKSHPWYARQNKLFSTTMQIATIEKRISTTMRQLFLHYALLDKSMTTVIGLLLLFQCFKAKK